MALDDLIDISIALSDPPLGLLDFTVPLIATTLSGPQATAFGAPVTKELTPTTWRTEMAAVGVSASEDPYIAFNTLFGQEEVRPSRAVWGRRATAVAQLYTYTVPGVPADGPYVVTLDGTPYSFTASSSTQTAVRDALIAAIDGATGLFDATSTGAGTFTVVALQPGRPFTSSVTSPGSSLTQALTTPNVGLDTDVALWRAENDAWYMLLENTRSDAAAHAMRSALAGLIKMGFIQTDDADAQGTASLTDIGSDLTAAGATRVAAIWHNNDDQWVDAALAGSVGPRAWGSAAYFDKVLALVTGIIPTNAARLESKRYTHLESFVAAGVSSTVGGRMLDGTWIDLRIGADALRNMMQIDLHQAKLNNPKIPYTEEGADTVRSVVRTSLLKAASAPHNFIDKSSIQITIPRVLDQSSTDRGNRHFPGVQWFARAQGAIATIGIQGTISA